MAQKKTTNAKNGALAGFVAVDAIPTAKRSSWAARALSQFMEESDTIVSCKFESDKTAISKQASLNKAAKLEQFSGKVKVHRRADTIYLEKI